MEIQHAVETEHFIAAGTHKDVNNYQSYHFSYYSWCR